MSQELTMWLFGGMAGLVLAAFGYTFIVQQRANAAAAKATNDLWEYKVHAATLFATLTNLGDLERRTLAALEAIEKSQERLENKLDRWVEASLKGGGP